MKQPHVKSFLSSFHHRHFAQIFRMLCFYMTIIYLVGFAIIAFQRGRETRNAMTSAANMLAIQLERQAASMQETALYIASLDPVDTLLHQETPLLETFVLVDDVLTSVSGRYAAIELFFQRSHLVLTSDFGLGRMETYLDRASLSRINGVTQQTGMWFLRSLCKSRYLDAADVISYARPLPLYLQQTLGQIVVSLPLVSLRLSAQNVWDDSLGRYTVWLGDALLLGEKPDTGFVQRATVGTRFSTACRMTPGQFFSRLLPPPLTAVGIYLICLLLTLALSKLIFHLRFTHVEALLAHMGAEPDTDLDSEQAVTQMQHIFDGMADELSTARQSLKSGQALIRERLIGELLRTRVTVGERADALKNCGIVFRYPSFAVIVLDLPSATDEQTLLIRSGVQTQLGELSDVYSTYGDGQSVLFLLNLPATESIGEALEKRCGDIREAVRALYAVDVLFSIGLCSSAAPLIHDAYAAARSHSATLRLLGEGEDEPVTTVSLSLAEPDEAAVDLACHAVLDQDAARLTEALERLSPPTELSAEDARRFALTVLFHIAAALTAADFQVGIPALRTELKTLQDASAEEAMQAVRRWCQGLVTHIRPCSDAAAQYVERASQYIREHYARHLNVSDIAVAASVNPVYLNRLFKTLTGQTISDYLHLFCAQQARDMLLAQPELPLPDVSDACGFTDSRSFVRFFKKYFEETPSEFRKRCCEK